MSGLVLLKESSRVFNRQSVLQAMTSTINKLKLYKKIPPNGLAIFSGLVNTGGNTSQIASLFQDKVEINETGRTTTTTTTTGRELHQSPFGEFQTKGKTKKICLAVEPLLPLKYSMYFCDDRFHTETLMDQLKEMTEKNLNGDSKYAVAYVIITGDGFLLGRLSGSEKEILKMHRVSLPKKHGRGGQSAVRFSRLREIARDRYINLIAENVNKYFLEDGKPTMTSLIIAGYANLKNLLLKSDKLDYRLKKISTKVIDICYGFEAGFTEAINSSKETLNDMKYIQERNLIQSFMDELAKDSSSVVFGFYQTLKACELGAVEKIIAWENLDTIRVTITNVNTKVQEIKYLSPKQLQDFVKSCEQSNHLTFEVQPLLEWLVGHFTSFGCTLEIVSDATSESKQFVHGFGGLAGFLRYPIDVNEETLIDEQQEEEDLSQFI